MRLHFKLKSPVQTDLDSIELTFTISTKMEHYKKRLTKKKSVDWDSNHQPDDYGLMAAYTIVFSPVDEQWALLACKNKLCVL